MMVSDLREADEQQGHTQQQWTGHQSAGNQQCWAEVVGKRLLVVSRHDVENVLTTLSAGLIR